MKWMLITFNVTLMIHAAKSSRQERSYPAYRSLMQHQVRTTSWPVSPQYPGLSAQAKLECASYFSLVISAYVLDYAVKLFRRTWKTCLHLVRRGRNAGKCGDEPLIYADASQEDPLVEELIVIVQQDRRVVHWRKSNSRNANLKVIIKCTTWLRMGGMGQTELFLLTALMKRLSVAAGKISFSRVIFLQLENNKKLWIYDASVTDSEHYYPKTAQVLNKLVYFNRGQESF